MNSSKNGIHNSKSPAPRNVSNNNKYVVKYLTGFENYKE
jgi:hypothetical protein